MSDSDEGIWVKLVIPGDSMICGFVSGADSPNDFWATFKSQLVRVDHATEELTNGNVIEHGTIYVNREQIVLAKCIDRPC